jgi:hypothetical protein
MGKKIPKMTPEERARYERNSRRLLELAERRGTREEAREAIERLRREADKQN